MTFTICLIALLLQRVLHFDNKLAKYDLFMMYYRWLHARFSQSTAWAGLTGVILVVLPGFILSIIFMMLIYHALGMVVYYVVSLFIVWYYLDARPLAKDSIDHVSARDVLLQSYQRIFAILFWFAVLGVVGVILYTLLASLRIELESQPQLSESENTLLESTAWCESVLDWIPVRLLGLTYALVGEFGATFALWSKTIFAKVGLAREQVVNWALVSLGYNPAEELIVDAELAKSIESLINRALLVWLVVMALFTIGHWAG